jgi:hypothetical protein
MAQREAVCQAPSPKFLPELAGLLDHEASSITVRPSSRKSPSLRLWATCCEADKMVREFPVSSLEGNTTSAGLSMGVREGRLRVAGMARMYSETSGKAGNCQVGVSVHTVTDWTLAAVDWRLFLPSSWDGMTHWPTMTAPWKMPGGASGAGSRTRLRRRSG